MNLTKTTKKIKRVAFFGDAMLGPKTDEYKKSIGNTNRIKQKHNEENFK